MKELVIRALSGAIYIALLLLTLYNQTALSILLLVFGFICLLEFNKLQNIKSVISFTIYILLYGFFVLGETIIKDIKGINTYSQILLVLTIITQLYLVFKLFANKKFMLKDFGKNWVTTFYISSAFVFLMLIANFYTLYNPNILLGSFILIWVSDTFAYLIGKNFGRLKIFPKISPKKTLEGYLGGIIFTIIASYFVSKYSYTLGLRYWLILAVIISISGAIGDLVESKFKRQVNVKDSGVIMPGHGGLLDRLDSMIFAAPFIFLLLTYLKYVS